ncbi:MULTISPECIES: cupin domain-containing protein [unclassified Sphingomonas]|jgi:mannose-6-phosphate isomerase-like protein (cupin superfamily)|uniref:cupin domain-containing protein n=1 Tax=unclassified Sphingomonas TaxID=196159 RepID=UPI00082E054C|nr:MULTISPECIES: cupin domain-containing protein [unclassified Sphingomonas]MCH4893032.1 cupin domain-containing protein [Sphingomonas sp. SFZ2018-12]
MPAPEPIVLADKLAAFADHWNPRVIGSYNGHELRVAKVQGDFTWHAHADTDELFLVLKGELGIEFRDGVRRLRAGEMIVVPRGTEHRPFAEEEVHMLMIDREGEPNTGDAPSHLTRATLETL